MAEGELWTTEFRNGWKVDLATFGDGLDVVTDVHVHSPEGDRWVGTVASIEAIQNVMGHHADSGEALGGRYFWSSELLVLRDATADCAFDSVFDLIATGELASCFSLVTDET